MNQWRQRGKTALNLNSVCMQAFTSQRPARRAKAGVVFPAKRSMGLSRLISTKLLAKVFTRPARAVRLNSGNFTPVSLLGGAARAIPYPPSVLPLCSASILDNSVQIWSAQRELAYMLMPTNGGSSVPGRVTAANSREPGYSLGGAERSCRPPIDRGVTLTSADQIPSLGGSLKLRTWYAPVGYCPIGLGSGELSKLQRASSSYLKSAVTDRENR